MKSGTFMICALLVLAGALCGSCYGQSTTNANAAQPSAPAAVAAGPSMSMESMSNMPFSGVAVDSNSVYVVRGNKLYKYAKIDIEACGTAIPPCQPAAAAGAGCGPYLTVSAPALSARGAAALAYLQGLTCADLDKAYLVAMINSQSSVISISQVAAQYGSRTSVQDFGVNATANAKSINDQFSSLLKTKFCTDIAICAAPPPISGFNICNPNVNRGRDFDITYMNAAVQYYTDEIALSTYEMQNGSDINIKNVACEIIKSDQGKINLLRRWLCGQPT
ncbi:MAG: hypothetical protein NT018_00400 [Armatimonadetes bacterium]|nr:hypothetical protein [Armatimonadota bacterium]